MRALLGSLSLVLGLVAGLGAPAPATATTPPTPAYGNLADLLPPSVTDPLIALLAPLPTPYKPYTGTICRSGEPACIDQVIAEMRTRLGRLAPTCDHKAIFSLAYLRVTQNVANAAAHGYFHDRPWLTRVDAVFAGMYFKTIDTWTSGHRAAVAPAWSIALQAADSKSVTAIGDFMLSMNAHINNDFPQVLATVGLTAANGTSHKIDHNAYNDRLDSLYYAVFREETARFDPTFDAINLNGLDLTLVGQIMRGWREIVWRNAEALSNAPAALKPAVQRYIAQYAATQAQLIKTVFAATPASTHTRDAYCSTHHG